MNTRLASLALALVIAAPASAFAQGYDAPRLDRTESRSFFGMPAWIDNARRDETATTGSIGPRRGYDSSAKDSSAKGGNAAQQDRLVPQYGNTAGGPAE